MQHAVADVRRAKSLQRGRKLLGSLVSLCVGVVGGVGMLGGSTQALEPGSSLCVLTGNPGDTAVVNETVVRAVADGHLTNRSSDDPFAYSPDSVNQVSSVNYFRGKLSQSIDLVQIGKDGKSCTDNPDLPGGNNKANIIRDLLVVIPKEVGVQSPTATGPTRIYDSRTKDGPMDSGETRCVKVKGQSGDTAVYKLTVNNPQAGGHIQVRSSDSPRTYSASNPSKPTALFGYSEGALAQGTGFSTIGADSQICIDNGPLPGYRNKVDAILDQFAIIPQEAGLRQPTANGAKRVLDTRYDGKMKPVGPGEFRCFDIEGEPGDATVLTVTAFRAGDLGHGALRSFGDPPVYGLPEPTALINYAPGKIASNSGIVTVDESGKACFDNVSIIYEQNRVDIVIDQGPIFPASLGLHTPSEDGAVRIADDREDVYDECPPDLVGKFC